MDFWERLDWLIKERGTSRKALASELGFSLSSFSMWKTRQTFPDADLAVRLAALLGVSVEYLVAGETPSAWEDSEAGDSEMRRVFIVPNEYEDLQQVFTSLMNCDREQVKKVKALLDILLG